MEDDRNVTDRSETRRQQQIELIKKSRDALDAEQSSEQSPGQSTGRGGSSPTASGPDESDGHGGRESNGAPVAMYRGRPLVGNKKLATPGAGAATGRRRRQSRGGAGRRGRTEATSTSAPGAEAVKDAIRKLTEMHVEGLITRQEYDRKRQQLLDRL